MFRNLCFIQEKQEHVFRVMFVLDQRETNLQKKLQYFKSLNELPPLSRQPVSQMNTLY